MGPCMWSVHQFDRAHFGPLSLDPARVAERLVVRTARSSERIVVYKPYANR